MVSTNRVMRVLPFEDETLNECWLSDRDRFSYEGLNSPDRLLKPMLKHDGKWHEVDWQTALEYVAKSLKGVKADLALRAVAVAESLEVDEEEIELEYARIAQRNNQKPNQVRKAYERNDAVSSLVAELRKRKALDWLVDHCEIVDLDGQPIDRAALNPVPAADDNEEEEVEDGDDA